MPPFLFVLIAIVLVMGMLLWLGALADGSDYAEEVFVAIGRTKGRTLVLVGLTLVFGGTWYWLRIRPGLRLASTALGDDPPA
jgi:fumarate reductase subunit D